MGEVDLEALRKWHTEGLNHCAYKCSLCLHTWPCPTIQLADEIERLESALKISVNDGCYFEDEIAKLRAALPSAWNDGFRHALWWYGTWKDGVVVIGCMDTPIKDCNPQEGVREMEIAALLADRAGDVTTRHPGGTNAERADSEAPEETR